MGGLGIRSQRRTEIQRPIDKFIPDDMKMELAKWLDYRKEIQSSSSQHQKATFASAGQIRNELEAD